MGRGPQDPRWRPIRPDGSLIPFAERPSALARATGRPVRDQEIGIERPGGGIAWVSINAEPIDAGGGAPFAVALTMSGLSGR